MNLVGRAATFAQRAHRKQLRKYTHEPYFVHLNEVAELCVEVGSPAEVVAAAYLHDYIEDQNGTVEELESLFGPVVARLVWEVSDQSRPEDGNRGARKAIDRAHLARASARGKTIKLADLISNSKDIVQRDPNFAVTYMREKRLLLPFLVEGNRTLFNRATELLESYETSR